MDANDPALPSLAGEFLRASIEYEQAEQQRLVRRARKLRQLVAILSCLVLIAATTTALAVLSRNELAGKRHESVSREVSDMAASLRVSDPDLAAQLALAAHRIADTAEARGALMTALVNLDPERRSDTDSADAVETVAFSHDGHLLAIGNQDGTTTLWDVKDPRERREMPPLPGHLAEVAGIAFSPDSSTAWRTRTDSRPRRAQRPAQSQSCQGPPAAAQEAVS